MATVEKSKDLETFQKVSYFLAALAHGAENNLGKGTNSICTLAGKKFGREAVSGLSETSDPIQALGILTRCLVVDTVPFLPARIECPVIHI